MTFRRTVLGTCTIKARFAIGVVLAVVCVSPAIAQDPFGPFKEAYTPAADAKDLRSVLFNWMRNTGMLRGSDERDMVASLEYQGKGTMQVEGQPCTLTKYRASTNYQSVSQRIQYTCTRPSGQTYSNIEVVSGLYAWNEDTPGAQIGPTKGNVTPKPDAAQERLIRIWASPQGAAKAALAGTSTTWWLGANPSNVVANGVMKMGQTSLVWEGGKPVLTFPIPSVPGAMATATLNAKLMAERVIVKHGSTTTEFTYGDYQDWNNPLNKIGALYAGKIAERQNGATVRDLTTDVTETGNVYVVAPVPASVQAAIHPTGQLPKAVIAKTEPPADTSAPTPRLNGHPDLSGNWSYTDWIGNYQGGGGRRCGPLQDKDCRRDTNQTEDFELYSPSRFGILGRPIYKPEFWDKVQQLDMWTNKEDPVMTCQPLGIPRHGTPRRIYQTANDVTMMYSQYADAGGGNSEFRVIPTDGRKHDPKKAVEATYMGYTVGRWEGDTLVLDSISFVDSTWLGRGGYFHSDQLHVIEKLTRKGNTILYEATVEDPEVLVQPWVMTPRTLVLDTRADAGLLPEHAYCEVYELKNISSQIRH